MCGTFYPIYLQGTHPNVSQMTNVSYDATVCFSDCGDTLNIKIRMCPGNDLQYYLKPTWPYSGYCLADANLPFNASAIQPPNVLLANVTVDVRLIHRLDNANRPEYIPETQFHCVFSVQDYWYSIDWFIDSRHFWAAPPTKDHSTSVLTDGRLLKANVTLPFYVKCSVRVSVTNESQTTDAVYSGAFFAGGKIDKRVLEIPKNAQTEIIVKTTIPIGCRYHKALEDPETYPHTCLIKLEITNADTRQKNCSAILNTRLDQSSITSTKELYCTKGMKALKANEIFIPNIEHKFPIATVDDTYDDQNVFRLDVRFREMRYNLWSNYAFPSVEVIVTNISVNEGIKCHSRADPHMRTADGVSYKQHRDLGEFMLYWNTKYDIEVQQKTHRCGGWAHSSATCACGVAIRAGKDVFMINKCGSINFMEFIQCGEGGILEVVELHTERYRILTPIGTKVEISMYSKSDINIEIFMAPKDFNNIVGLCGTFDKDPQNDFKHYNSNYITKTTYYPDDFSSSWNIANTTDPTLEKKNLFRYSQRNLDYWKTRNQVYCLCNGTNTDTNVVAVCSPSQYLNCNISGSITANKCHVNKGFRRRRDTRSHEKELNRLFSLMQKPRTEKHAIYKRQANNISLAEATDICENRIDGMIAFDTMAEMTVTENKAQIIADCIFDLQVTGDPEYADVHVDSVNSVVKTMLYNQPYFASNHTEDVKVFLEASCPFNCTGKGICVLRNGDGVCSCNKFYHGAACTIDERTPVMVDDIEGGGQCDIAEGDDCTCFIIRVEALLPNFKCNITTYRRDVNGSAHLINSNQVTGIYEDIYTGRCCASQGIMDIKDAFSITYTIAVSNDAVNYGEKTSVHVYNSVCQRNELMENNRIVLLAVDLGCYIDGGCIANGQTASFDGCLACNGTLDPYSYSQVVCTTSPDPKVITKLDTTNVPATTTVPDTTSKLDTTKEPATTTVPDTTTKLDTSNVSDTTTVLETTTKLDTTKVPDTITVPDTTTKLDTTNVQTNSTVPDTTTKFDTTNVPVTTTVLETTTKLDTTKLPNTTTVPDTTSKFDTTSVPYTNTVLSTTQVPDTTIIQDKTTIIDTTTKAETTILPDGVTVPDTTTIPHTNSLPSTITVSDTTTKSDTTKVQDTTKLPDTISVSDQTTVTDTTKLSDKTILQDTTSVYYTNSPASANEANAFITYVAVIPSAIIGSLILVVSVALCI